MTNFITDFFGTTADADSQNGLIGKGIRILDPPKTVAFEL